MGKSVEAYPEMSTNAFIKETNQILDEIFSEALYRLEVFGKDGDRRGLIWPPTSFQDMLNSDCLEPRERTQKESLSDDVNFSEQPISGYPSSFPRSSSELSLTSSTPTRGSSLSYHSIASNNHITTQTISSTTPSPSLSFPFASSRINSAPGVTSILRSLWGVKHAPRRFTRRERLRNVIRFATPRASSQVGMDGEIGQYVSPEQHEIPRSSSPTRVGQDYDVFAHRNLERAMDDPDFRLLRQRHEVCHMMDTFWLCLP